jgi:hypothetical protein
MTTTYFTCKFCNANNGMLASRNKSTKCDNKKKVEYEYISKHDCKECKKRQSDIFDYLILFYEA